jgi:hypothetical protein
MIIKQHPSIRKKKFRFKGILVLLLLSFAILTAVIGYFVLNRKQTVLLKDGDMQILANAEEVSGQNFVVGTYNTTGVASRSQEKAFDGEYSVKLFGPDQQYGFTYEFKDLKAGEQLVLQVWRHANMNEKACLAISATNPDVFYQQICSPIRKEKEWELLKTIVKVPDNLEDNILKVYCYNPTPQAAYFDALSFFRSSQKVVSWKPDKIALVLKEGEYKKLEQNRKKALRQGILQTTKDSWVKGAIYPEDKASDKIKVDLRLKGDWLDHLQGEQWSFRVETAPDKAWNRLKTFSLQHPRTRSYLKEWFLHQWFDEEDLLTTRYEFVELELNAKKLGVYVCEEHFLKQIPEYNLRREGPIVKFTEDGLWENRIQASRIGLDQGLEEDKANPDIRPFKESKTFKSPALKQQFELAQNLLYEYQHGLKPLKEVFDLEMLAKYYAIMDVAGAHHGAIWHNQRFYYNPVIGKLEPIGYDGYNETGYSWLYFPFLGVNRELDMGDEELFNNIFDDWEFAARYHHYLNQYSQKSYLDSLFAKLQEPLEERLLYLISVEPDYNYSNSYIYERANKIQLALLPNSSSLQTRTIEAGKIAVCNRHFTAIEIIGSANAKDGALQSLDEALILPTTPSKELPDFSKKVDVPKTAKYLVYRVLGLDQNYYAEINPWSVPEAFTPVQELQPNLDSNARAYRFDPEQRLLVFAKNAVIEDPIIIPEDYHVIIPAGSKIDIRKKAFVLSYSAVEFLGSEEQPILVHSSDASAMAFTVIKAKKKSKVNYTTFSNMNTLSYKGWNLTGAVTFYESDVDIYHSNFTHNHCEDALNIVRSNFNFDYSSVTYTYADGFDADFCEGRVNHGYFNKTGNDGIDFSTSLIEIVDTKIDSAGDKGISIGEQGTAFVKNTSVNGAVIGIASKDLSQVTIESIDLKNCQEGFSAYQKKPEYGGGNIVVKAYTAENVERLYKIFPGSYLRLIDQEIKGD